MIDAKERFKQQQAWLKALLASSERLIEKTVGARLALYQNMKTGRLDPSYVGLARDTRKSKSTVLRSIAILEANRWIEVYRPGGGRKTGGKRGRTNSFTLAPPPIKGVKPMTPFATIKGVKINDFKGVKNSHFHPVKGVRAVTPEHTKEEHTIPPLPPRGENNAAPDGAAVRAHSHAGQEGGTNGGKPANGDWPSDYRQQFWDAYPNRVGQRPAFQALTRLHRKRDRPAWDDLMNAINRYAAHLRSYGHTDQKPLNPKTWIAEERWNDQP